MLRQFIVSCAFCTVALAAQPHANYCLDLDGKSSGAVLDYASGIQSLNGVSRYTFEAWVRPRSQGGGGRGRILDQEGSSLTFYLSDEGRVGFRPNRESGWQLSEANSIKFWKWQHVAVTSDGKLLRFFVDGKLVTAIPTSTTLNITRKPVFVGTGLGEDNTARGFDGWLDEIRVSDVCRWTKDFTLPKRGEYTAPNVSTALYLPFDEGPAQSVALDYSTYNAEIKIVESVRRVKAPK